jgi:hypothetical protein
LGKLVQESLSCYGELLGRHTLSSRMPPTKWPRNTRNTMITMQIAMVAENSANHCRIGAGISILHIMINILINKHSPIFNQNKKTCSRLRTGQEVYYLIMEVYFITSSYPPGLPFGELPPDPPGPMPGSGGTSPWYCGQASSEA